MKILLDNRNLIQFIGNDIEFGIWDEPNVEKWKIDGYYAIDNGYSLVEVAELPLDVIPCKHFYINGDFVLNPNYVNQSEQEQRITELETMLSALLD